MKTLRNVVSVADRLSPRVAAQIALRLFLTPPRVPRPAHEVELLAVGRPLTVLLDRKAIAAWSWGDGPTVLLVHGWGGRGTQLGALVPPLVNAGFRVVTFDGTAHGDTDGRLTTLAQLARVIRAVADAAGEIEAVVAHSFGAAATTVALAHGLVARRAVYIAPVFEITGAVQRYAAGAGLSERAAALFRTGLAQANRATAEQLDGHTLAPKLTAELTVIHDVGDREVPFAEGQAAARVWPGARLVETSGLGHRRILDDADVIGIVRDVVAGRAVAPHVLDDAWRIERELLDRDSRRLRSFP